MNPLVAFIKLIRLPNLLIIVLTQYAIRFAIMLPILKSTTTEIEGFDLGLQMTELDFFLLSLSTVMVAAAGYIINDYFDVKVDRVNRPNSIIVGKYIKRRVCMGAHIVISTIAILMGVYLAYKLGHWNLALIQILSVGALWYYSTMFKKQVLIGNVIVAILAALVPFVAGLYELILLHQNADVLLNKLLFYLEADIPTQGVRTIYYEVLSNLMKWVLGFALFAFISTIIREIVKDIEDYEGDKKYWSNTLAVVYGKRKAVKVAQLFILIMMALIAYLQYLQILGKDVGSFIYFLMLVQIPMVFIFYKLQLANQKDDYSRISTYIKLVMLTGIVYAFYFYYTSF